MSDDEEAQLLHTYRNVCQAVAFTEMIICQPSDEEGGLSSWSILMASKHKTTKQPLTPDQVVEMIRYVLEEPTNDEREALRIPALEQTKHPEFLTYIKGKMGAV